MAKSYRFDRATIQQVESNDGFLRGQVKLARPGVFPYLTPGGSIRLEAKLPDELFSAKTIDSGQGKPITDGHPVQGLIRADNYQELVKGSLSNVRSDGSFLIGLDTVYDASLRADILSSKKVEVSIGFEQELDETPGIYNGQRYDAVQRNIRINHMAHVAKGRGGESVKFQLDSGLDFAVMQDPENGKPEINMPDKTKTFRTDDGQDLQVPEGLHPVMVAQKAAIDKLRADMDEQIKAKDEQIKAKDEKIAGLEQKTETKTDAKDDLATSVTELAARIDALNAENEALKKTVTHDALDQVVQSRLALYKNAEKLIPDVSLDGLSETEIKLAVIKEHLAFDESVKLDSLEPVTIDARYDAACDLASHKASNNLIQSRTDSVPEGLASRQNLFMPEGN